jgi:metal-sulfur cluster biosynthetic enzyme
MSQEASIREAINKVEHPEIAMSLVSLGMVRDVEVDPQDDSVTLTLVVPFLGIPQAVMEYMANSLTMAVSNAGGTMKKIDVAEMNDAERQAFFSAEEENWRQ